MNFVKVVENKSGAIYSIINDTEEGIRVLIDIEQKDDNGDIRKAQMIGCLEPVLQMDFYVNQVIPGRIKIKESFDPIIPDELERYIKRDSNGDIVRVRGKVVYRTTYHTRDRNDMDELIE